MITDHPDPHDGPTLDLRPLRTLIGADTAIDLEDPSEPGPTPAMLALLGLGPASDLPAEPVPNVQPRDDYDDRLYEADAMAATVPEERDEHAEWEARAHRDGEGWDDQEPPGLLDAAGYERPTADLDATDASSAPLTPGSTWTGPDGTVYDVVRPEEVGDRPRWWIWRGAEPQYRPGGPGAFKLPGSTADLHVNPPLAGHGDDEIVLALVLHRDVKPENVSGDERRRFMSPFATLATALLPVDPEADRLANEAMRKREAERGPPVKLVRATELDAARAQLADLRTSLRSLLGLPAGADDEAVRAAVEGLKQERDALNLIKDTQAARIEAADERIEAATLIIAETRSKLAAADRACEAARDAKRLAEHGEATAKLQADIVQARIGQIVDKHIVRTTSEEPALEGLLRIERALIEGGKAQEALKRMRAANRKLRKERNALRSMKVRLTKYDAELAKTVKAIREPRTAKRKPAKRKPRQR